MNQAVIPGQQAEKNAVSASPNEFRQTDTAYFFYYGLPFHAFRQVSFYSSAIYIHSRYRFFWNFNLPLLPFTSIFASSGAHQSVIFVQVQRYFRDFTEMQGQASCFLQKSPHLMLRVVFFRKTLHLLIPTL